MIVLFKEEHFNPIGRRFLKKVLMYLSAVHLATDGVAWLKNNRKWHLIGLKCSLLNNTKDTGNSA